MLWYQISVRYDEEICTRAFRAADGRREGIFEVGNTSLIIGPPLLARNPQKFIQALRIGLSVSCCFGVACFVAGEYFGGVQRRTCSLI